MIKLSSDIEISRTNFEKLSHRSRASLFAGSSTTEGKIGHSVFFVLAIRAFGKLLHHLTAPPEEFSHRQLSSSCESFQMVSPSIRDEENRNSAFINNFTEIKSACDAIATTHRRIN